MGITSIEHYQKDEFEKAIENFNKFLELNPDSGCTYYNLGIIYFREQKFDLAVHNFKKASELNEDDAETLFNLGISYFENKEYQLAIDCLKKASSINPHDAESYYNLGISYLENGDYKLAKENFEHVVNLDPNHCSAKEALNESKKIIRTKVEEYYKAGQECMDNNELNDAIKNFEQALLINPRHMYSKESLYKCIKQLNAENSIKAEPYYNIGVFYYDLGKNDIALENLQLALELDPSHVKARGFLDKIMFELNMTAQDKNLKNDRNKLYNLGVLYTSLTRYSEAISCFNKALELDLNSYEIHDALKNARILNKEVAADKDLAKYKEAEPYFHMGVFYYDCNDKDSAKSYLTKVIDICPDHKQAKQILAIIKNAR